jgi:hypothetical protein
MKINIYFLLYIAQFLLEKQMFRTTAVEKIKTQILCSKKLFFPRKSSRLRDNVESIVERCRPQMTVRLTLIACWVLNSTDTHSDFVILIAFPQ